MFPKSPTRQMYPNPGQQPYTPYPIPQLPPMAQKKKGFLAKLFKKHDPTEPFMQMVPPYRQMEGQPMMHQQPPPPQYQQQYQQQYHQQYQQQHPQYQPYMQQHPEQMIPLQMYESNETRGGATTAAATASSGIGSFFSNLISNPTNMINNIEKVSQVVQSVGPVVEQYGPIMRSLPSIVKILTSGKSTEENQTENVTEPVEVESPPPAPQKKKRKRKKIVIEPVIEKELPKEPVQQTATKPKLYV
ncbi:VrrA protein [Bacillus sp. 007/AIA-02/001]|uniref:YqfQ family protein n=1 Tax=Bacillus sp. 007/AIA-02/001 TaxID=2509009 RepID=UPI00107557BF|nr:YqfQ family protein [Bacillus sp. 007/AIA-02/001]TFW55137.1 VrrA protein [Bacillus sp. 007/AIA-02/001]